MNGGGLGVAGVGVGQDVLERVVGQLLAGPFALGHGRQLDRVVLVELVDADIGLLALALARFEVFVLAVLASRTTLDAFKLGGAATIPDPAALLGILFIGVSVIWLITETRRPDAAPP